MASTTPETAPSTVESNIRTVAELEQNFEQHRSPKDLIADVIGGFSGSIWFVVIHVVIFTLWFLSTAKVFPFFPHFDPYPFILLAMTVSVEGVLLSTFVLMKQNRMQQRSDARDHLNLQIDLLSEKEVTKLFSCFARYAGSWRFPRRSWTWSFARWQILHRSIRSPNESKATFRHRVSLEKRIRSDDQPIFSLHAGTRLGFRSNSSEPVKRGRGRDPAAH